MKKIKFCSLIVLITVSSIAQVGIGTTTVDPSAALELVSNDKGILVPRMSQAQRLAINPAASARGLLVFQIDESIGFWFFDGAIWREFQGTGGGGTGWSITGDSGTDPAINYAGTSDDEDLVIVANGAEIARVNNSQLIGIGETNPQALLHISAPSPAFRLEDGTEAPNLVLTSDADGNASWQALPVPPSSSFDDDWQFFTGTGQTTVASATSRRGSTVIGRTGTTTHLLDVDNGANTGTTIGVGDNEFIEDGNNETMFSHSILPFGITVSNPEIAIRPILGNDMRRWVTVYATNGNIQTSDATLKENIKTLPYGTKDLMKLRPVSFYWKEEKRNQIKIPDDQRDKKYGFIAQEVEKVVPEVVHTYGYKPEVEEVLEKYVRYDFERIGMNYEELIPLLVKVEQEQDEEIKQLLKKIKGLKEVVINNKNSKK